MPLNSYTCPVTKLKYNPPGFILYENRGIFVFFDHEIFTMYGIIKQLAFV